MRCQIFLIIWHAQRIEKGLLRKILHWISFCRHFVSNTNTFSNRLHSFLFSFATFCLYTFKYHWQFISTIEAITWWVPLCPAFLVLLFSQETHLVTRLVCKKSLTSVWWYHILCHFYSTYFIKWENKMLLLVVVSLPLIM